MATSTASSEHFEKLHEIFRGLHEDLRRVPERLLGTAGTGEAGAGGAAGNSVARTLGGKVPTLLPGPRPSSLRSSSSNTPPRASWVPAPGAPCFHRGFSGMDLGSIVLDSPIAFKIFSSHLHFGKKSIGDFKSAVLYFSRIGCFCSCLYFVLCV